MHDRIDISIITATRNAAATLPRTLKSVSEQTCRNFEHIIIDGASTDGSLELIKNYAAEQDVPVTVVSEPDQGLYDALNKGYDRARGTYLLFLNAGDSFHSAATLEQVCNVIQSYENTALPAVIYGETDIVDINGKFLRHRRLKAPKNLTWRSFRWGMLVCHQSFYGRRDLAPRYKQRYRFSSDFDWCIRLLLRASDTKATTHRIDDVLTDYLNEGLTTKNHKASLHERRLIMEHYYGKLTTLLLHVWFAIRSIVK